MVGENRFAPFSPEGASEVLEGTWLTDFKEEEMKQLEAELSALQEEEAAEEAARLAKEKEEEFEEKIEAKCVQLWGPAWATRGDPQKMWEDAKAQCLCSIWRGRGRGRGTGRGTGRRVHFQGPPG